MHIEKKKEYDYEEYGSRWQEIVWFDNYQYIKEVKKDLEAIERLLDVDFKDLSDRDFYSLISNFYSVYLTKRDILGLASKVNGVLYDKFEKLNSRMTFKDMVTEGHGRDFSWWEETYQLEFLVMTSEDIKLDSDYNYSKEEILEMIRNKQIVSLGCYAKAVGFEPVLPYETEKVEKLDILKFDLEHENKDDFICRYRDLFKFDNLKEGDSSFSQAVYKNAISLLRKRLNKKKVINDCKDIILFLNDNIELVDEVVRDGIYMDEGEREEYLDLSKDLSSSHKSLSLRFGSSKK